MRNTQITTHRRQSRQLLSARRAATYERPGGGVLPEHFFDSRIKLAAVCPETALMYAVLEDAFMCFHEKFAGERGFMRRGGKPRNDFLAMIRVAYSPSSLSATR